jgi:RimK family alpha-L-glutamate ligase
MNNLKFSLIIHKITPNNQDLIREINKKGFSGRYLFFKNIRISGNQTRIIFSDETGKTTNGLDSNIILWRDTKTQAIIRKIIAGYFLNNKKIFIDRVWAEKDWTANKLRQAEFYSQQQLPLPKTIFTNSKNFDFLVKNISLPFIAKPIVGSKGNNVFLINDKAQFQKFCNKFPLTDFIFQKYIPNDGDFRLLCVGKKFIGGYKRIPKKGEFRANIAQGGSGKIIKLNPLLINLAEKVSRITKIEILGIDFIQSKTTKSYYLMETNGIPQWQGFKKTTGINVAEKIIDYSLSLYKKIS